jgi:hypothetical protein
MTTFELLTLCAILARPWLPINPDGTTAKRSYGHSCNRVETVLGRFEGEPHPAIAVARGKVAETLPFRIDAGERIVEEVENAVWIRGWMRVDLQDIEANLALRIDKLGRAIEALSTIRQAVFSPMLAMRCSTMPLQIASGLPLPMSSANLRLPGLIDAAVNEG